ncbi:GIY-YIG nuclease family protein [Rhodovulum sulfidophilum]|uniref:GIY-YIG nuclease family protein n=1 Tax=Rhodovulum sulfidophilum TaxID=35806 RepID=A0ABS1RZ66_RHOSU|nr:GIY-YIG nuclease family protein [Rhodovulum sulfidophilum]MBL3611202.1 GIY-YIG nuclease family protein [Rhodovulum sulfidophilum]MCE8439914.1 GIY-YIG nuclease family protein [Rhodovulum sulfidophilum]MCE8456686.1 GIY-YIG nuclease family protein [Rhodovulum sulfidophilum]MCE8467543.1 GIY-YIG nuclease family protein [Rhodovulum sulfidophilum]
MANMFTDDDDALLSELGIEVEKKKLVTRTPREERIIAGFEDIQKFVAEHGRLPQHSEDGDIFERLYAVRLQRLRELPEAADLLADLDADGLLSGAEVTPVADDLDDDALLAALGVEVEASPITELKHVRSNAERKEAEDIANRQRCEDFETFQPLFEKVQRELDSGQRETRPFELKAEIQKGRFFIVEGQKAYVAEMGEETLTDQGRRDARLRVIFDNGTESKMLMRSLQRALNKDESGRRITESVAGPLFADAPEEGDSTTGTVYVLRSKSDHPMVSENRDLVHKIGVTTLGVEKRIAGAQLQPTFLMAPVEVVATYELYNINQTRLENLIHRIFGNAQLDIEIPDRFGRPVTPREWFLVPLFVIDEAVQKIKDGTITKFRYDPEKASLVSIG